MALVLAVRARLGATAAAALRSHSVRLVASSAPPPRRNASPRRSFQPSGQGASRGASRPPAQDTPLMRYRQTLASKRSLPQAWAQYEDLCRTDLGALSFLDHVKLLQELSKQGRRLDLPKIDAIFEHLQGFSLQPSIFELMARVHSLESAAATQKYIDLLISKHGEDAVTPNSYAALLKAYRREGNHARALEIANQVQQAGKMDMHPLKPALAAIHIEAGNADQGHRLLDEYVAAEPNSSRIVAAHGMIAGAFLKVGRPDDAKKVFQALQAKGHQLDAACEAILANMALDRGDLAEAAVHVDQSMAAIASTDSGRTFFVQPLGRLLEAYCKGGHVDKAVASLKRFAAMQQGLGRTMSLMPYQTALENVHTHDAIVEVANTIPTRARLRSRMMIRAIVDAYMAAGHRDAAMEHLRLAHHNGGLDPKDPELNEAYIFEWDLRRSRKPEESSATESASVPPASS